MELFLKGLLIGFAIAAPVGPIAMLVIQRTLQYGGLSGLLTGFGAATADGMYGAVAAFGLTLISESLTEHQFWLRLIGGGFLLYLGAKIFLAGPAEQAATKKHKGLIYDYFSTVFLTLTSPVTIIGFIALFAGLGIGGKNYDMMSAALISVGLGAGSALWWVCLSGSISFFRAKLPPRFLEALNKVSGLIITGFGLFALNSIRSLG
jgi:threonine/homoserine/homoserine lactone efflux protein